MRTWSKRCGRGRRRHSPPGTSRSVNLKWSDSTEDRYERNYCMKLCLTRTTLACEVCSALRFYVSWFGLNQHQTSSTLCDQLCGDDVADGGEPVRTKVLRLPATRQSGVARIPRRWPARRSQQDIKQTVSSTLMRWVVLFLCCWINGSFFFNNLSVHLFFIFSAAFHLMMQKRYMCSLSFTIIVCHSL